MRCSLRLNPVVTHDDFNRIEGWISRAKICIGKMPVLQGDAERLVVRQRDHHSWTSRDCEVEIRGSARWNVLLREHAATVELHVRPITISRCKVPLQTHRRETSAISALAASYQEQRLYLHHV